MVRRDAQHARAGAAQLPEYFRRAGAGIIARASASGGNIHQRLSAEPAWTVARPRRRLEPRSERGDVVQLHLAQRMGLHVAGRVQQQVAQQLRGARIRIQAGRWVRRAKQRR